MSAIDVRAGEAAADGSPNGHALHVLAFAGREAELATLKSALLTARDAADVLIVVTRRAYQIPTHPFTEAISFAGS